MPYEQNATVYERVMAYDPARIGTAAVYCNDGRLGVSIPSLQGDG